MARYYLNREWERNRVSLVRYLQQVHRGLKGVVEQQDGAAAAGAVVVVAGQDKTVTTSERGEYWRLLLPGQYRITASLDLCDKAGIILTSLPFNISISSQEQLVVRNITLDQAESCATGPR